MQVEWVLDNLQDLGGAALSVEGAPKLIESPRGPAVEFDGERDGIFLDANPLAGWATMTVEVWFRPDAGGLPEQRFFHLGAVSGDRVLFETRLTDDGQWYLDTFISSGDSMRPLLNEQHLHPVGEWYHLAMTCDGREEVNYVNGVQEASGPIDFAPLPAGQASIGVRLNRVCWFKGAIGRIRFTEGVLTPEDFMQVA